MNAYIKFGENMSVISQDIDQKRNFRAIKGHNSDINVRKMMLQSQGRSCQDNADKEFGEILTINAQIIELKQNFATNQGAL